MAAILDPGHQGKEFPRNPTQDKERSLDTELVKQIQRSLRVGDHARGILIPGRPGYLARKGFHLKIVFYIDRQDELGGCGKRDQYNVSLQPGQDAPRPGYN